MVGTATEGPGLDEGGGADGGEGPATELEGSETLRVLQEQRLREQDTKLQEQASIIAQLEKRLAALEGGK